VIGTATGEPAGATGEKIVVRLTAERTGASVGDLVPCWARAEKAVKGIGTGGRATAIGTGIGAAGSARG
jgi:hypothetical protein